MLQAFFLWFYCLSIADVIVLVILVSAGYLTLRNWLENLRIWQLVITVFLLVWLAVIAVATLMDRTPSDALMEPQLLPFHSYRAVINGENKEILRSNFMNVTLFYPAGLMTCELLPKSWSKAKKVILVALLFALVSVGVEFCQYLYSLGRCEIDDVIHNVLGALIGALICTTHIRRKPCKSQN